MTMDITRKKRHVFRLAAIVVILVACIWLVPPQIGLSDSSPRNLSVQVKVMDSVASRIGSPAHSGADLQSPGPNISRTISRTARYDLGKIISGGAVYPDSAYQDEMVITTIKIS